MSRNEAILKFSAGLDPKVFAEILSRKSFEQLMVLHDAFPEGSEIRKIILRSMWERVDKVKIKNPAGLYWKRAVEVHRRALPLSEIEEGSLKKVLCVVSF